MRPRVVPKKRVVQAVFLTNLCLASRLQNGKKTNAKNKSNNPLTVSSVARYISCKVFTEEIMSNAPGAAGGFQSTGNSVTFSGPAYQAYRILQFGFVVAP